MRIVRMKNLFCKWMQRSKPFKSKFEIEYARKRFRREKYLVVAFLILVKTVGEKSHQQPRRECMSLVKCLQVIWFSSAWNIINWFSVEAVQWYNFVGKETKILRAGDSKSQNVLNSLGECLNQVEKPMGLIASHKSRPDSVPKICFLQPDRCDDSKSYSFICRYMPSSLTNRKLGAARLQKPRHYIQDLVNGYMGTFLNSPGIHLSVIF